MTLTRKDLELRQKEQVAENPGAEITLGVAYRQLERAYVGAAILKKYSRPITPESLRDEDERIHKSTLMPEKLRELEAIFPDKASFRNLYVLPVLVNRTIYFDFFAVESRFHKPAEALAASLVKDVQQGRLTLAQAAEKHKLTVFDIKLTKDGLRPLKAPPGLERQEDTKQIPSAVAKKLSQDKTGDPILDKIRAALPSMKDGDFFPLITTQTHFQVLRLKQGRAPEPTFESVAVPKTNFDEWFAKEKRLIAIECFMPQVCGGK